MSTGKITITLFPRSGGTATGALCQLVLFTAWVCSIILAKGFWSTLFAVCIPFWAWYLTIERAFTLYLPGFFG